MSLRLIPLAFLALAACSPGDGRPAGPDESKTYDLQGFTKIAAAAGVLVTLTQGPYAVSAKSSGGDLSHLRVELRGEELSVSSQGIFNLGKSPTYNVSITAPKFTALTTAAGAQFSGADLNLSDIKLSAAAGGIMNLSGTCWNATLDAAAGGIIRAADLKCQSTSAKAVAGGIIEITATDKADLAADAGGIITIGGNPPAIAKNTSIGGVINTK